MSPITNKPYVWLDKTTGSSIVRSVVFFDVASGIRESGDRPERRLEEDTLFLIYHTADEGEKFSELAFDLSTLSRSEYDPLTHTKVTVLLADADENILGFHTIKPDEGDFSYLGSAPFFIPYLYLQTLDTDNSTVHIAAWLPKVCDAIELEPVDDEPSFTRTVTFKIENIMSTDFDFKFLEHYLNAGSGYDPALDKVIIKLVELDPGGVERKKGTGTTHGSEGDASGDD